MMYRLSSGRALCLILLSHESLAQQFNGSQVPYTLTPSALTTLPTSSKVAAITSFSSTLGNGSCPSCAVGAQGGGLVQFAWFPESIELVLDTISLYVTIHSGTNHTAAVTSTSTIYGELANVDVQSVTEIESIMSKYLGDSIYGDNPQGRAILVRGTDGTLGSITSIPWPTPFVKISSVVYSYTTPYSDDYLCPSGQQYATKLGTSCVCGMTKAWLHGYEPDGLTSSSVALPSVFYYPLDPAAFNWSRIENGDFHDLEFSDFDPAYLSSWLVTQPWATSLLPNLRQCVFNEGGALQGPPGVKIPVAALTSTASTTITIKDPPIETGAKPADTVTDSLPASTSGPKPGQPGADPDTVPGSQPNSDAPVNNPATPTEIPPVVGQGDEIPDGGLGQSGSDPDRVPGSQSNSDGPVHNPAIPTTISPVADQGGDISDGDSDSLDSVGTKYTPTIKPGEPTPEVVVNSETKSAVTNTPDSPVPVLIVGDTITLPPSTSKLPIAGTIVSVNGPAATISGQRISLADGGLVIGTQTHSFMAPAATAITAIGGQTFSRIAHNDAIVVAGSTISRGAPAIKIGGVSVFLNPSAIIYGSSTVSIPPYTPTNVLTAAGQTITPVPSGIIVSGHTLQPGGPAVTISGTPISLAGPNIVVGTSTIPLPTQASSTTLPSTFSVGGLTFTRNTNGLIIADNTLTATGNAITVSGTPISLGSSGLVIGTSTYDFPTTTRQTSSSILTIGGQTLTFGPSGMVVAGTTLTPGASPLTVSGVVVSLGASDVVIGDSTYALPTTSPDATTVSLDGENFTITSDQVQVTGTVMSEGQEVTISGMKVSLGATGLVVGSQTIALAASTQGLGDVIMSAFGPHGTVAATGATGTGGDVRESLVVPFTGAACGRVRVGVGFWALVAVVGWMMGNL